MPSESVKIFSRSVVDCGLCELKSACFSAMTTTICDGDEKTTINEIRTSQMNKQLNSLCYCDCRCFFVSTVCCCEMKRREKKINHTHTH